MIIEDKHNKTNLNIAKAKHIILFFYILSSLLLLSFSIFSVQNSLEQKNENKTNLSNENNISQTFTMMDNKKPMHIPNQMIVAAEDIEKIKNNLQGAYSALSNSNYSKVLSHINKIDQLLTTFVTANSSSINNNIQSNNSKVLASLNNDSSIVEEYNKLIEEYNNKSKKIIIN